MVEPTQRQLDYQAASVIRNVSSRLDVAAFRSGIPVRDIVRMIREGQKVLHVPVKHDYAPFDTDMRVDGETITIQLPDLTLWDKAVKQLGLES